MFDQYQDSYDKELGYEELSEKTLKELLFGRRIVDVRPGEKNYFGGLDISALVLDDGTTVYVVPNEGCGGCVTGNWWIEKIATTNNAITDVRWVTDNYHSNPDIGDCNERVQIFVYTESSTKARKSSPLQATRITASTAMVSSFTSLVLKPRLRTRRSGGTT